MNRNPRKKHRKPSDSPFVQRYMGLKNKDPKLAEAFKKTLNRNQIKKLNRA